MYVMQSLPTHEQSLAAGIYATLLRLSQTVALGMSTAVFASVDLTPAGLADPSLKYSRAFLVSVGLAAFGVLCVPFVRLKTQGNAVEDEDEPEPEPGR